MVNKNESNSVCARRIKVLTLSHRGLKNSTLDPRIGVQKKWQEQTRSYITFHGDSFGHYVFSSVLDEKPH